MGNRYHVAPESDLESYIRRHPGKVKLPDSYLATPQVSPFDTRVFMTVGHRLRDGLHG